MADGMAERGKLMEVYEEWARKNIYLSTESGFKAFMFGRLEGLRLAEEIAKTPISKLYGMDVMRKYDEIAEAIRAEREKLEGQQ